MALLLLLCVCPLLSDAKYQVTYQENSDNGDNLYFKQAKKCISCSNFFPEGDGGTPNVDQEQAKCIDGSNSFCKSDRGILNADLNRWCEGQNCYDKCGKYRRAYCQAKGNSFKLYLKLKLSKSLSSFSSTKSVMKCLKRIQAQ